MATKKETKKPAAKKPAAKKPAAKAASASKQQALKSLAVLPTVNAASAKGKAGSPAARRPTPNPPLDNDTITAISNAFAAIRELLEESSANIRALDRARLNGVGIKKQGFIERAYASAAENLQFLPQYLDIDKFRDDFQYFVNLRTVYNLCSQLREFIWNLVSQSADISYTDALEYYASVREAAKRRIDGAETIHRELEPFFKKTRPTGEDGKPETKKQLKRDFNALQRGKRDGKIVIENISPKATGGVHKVVDEKFTDTDRFQETVEGEISK